MPGAIQHLARLCELDHLAVLHHRHPVGDLGHHAEVVGDEQHAGVALGLEILDEREDLGLSRDVERRRRLVRDHDGRLEDERHGDHRPLALSARELVRIGVRDALGLGQAHVAQDLDDALEALRTCKVGVRVDHLVDLITDGHEGIERGHRLLEDHRDPPAAHPAHVRRRHLQKVLALEADDARARMQPRRQQAHDGARHHRLARPRLSDHAEDLVRAKRETHVLDRVGAVRPGGEIHGQALDVEQGVGHRSLVPKARVEGVVQPLPHQVDREHREQDGDPRNRAKPPGGS